MTEQQQWNRYVNAMDNCIELGYDILPIFSQGSSNVKAIRVRSKNSSKETYIPLKPKKYTTLEPLTLIKENL